MRHWTTEERARQALLVQRWKPWKQSTGAKTEQGKKVSAMNSRKHGFRSKEWIVRIKTLNQLLRDLRENAKSIYGQ